MKKVITRELRLENINKLISLYKGKKFPQKVKIVEVGARDGLQNEKTIVSTEDKIKFINILSESGLQTIEATSFVSPKWIPQMGDNTDVFMKINKNLEVSYPVLVPNLQGLQQAMKAGVEEIAVFGAVSETFSKKNTNCTIADSLKRIEEVIKVAKQQALKVRGYISCVMGCPYEGDVNPVEVRKYAQALLDMGCYEISLGDTIGSGTVEKTQNLLDALAVIPSEKLAVHFHDTQNTAIENILIALERGITVVDSSVAGLGGCPYAKSASGNVCTENILHVFKELGIETGIFQNKIKEAGEFITGILKRENMCLF